MDRRKFIGKSIQVGATLSVLPQLSFAAKDTNRLVASYYLRAGMFTQRPDNLKRDLDLMKENGTDILCISMHYLQLLRAGVNTERIVKETRDRGMKLYIIPARVAGLTAASPIISFFTVNNPHALSLKKNGTPNLRRNQGHIGSFYHPDVFDYVSDFSLKLIENWDVDGIVWDEPKCTYWQDFSERALKNNPTGDFRTYIADMADFFSRINDKIKAKKKDCTIVHFDEATRGDIVVEESAKIRGVDYYGCDGKPWPKNLPKDSTKGTPKNLFENGTRYLKEAKKNKKGSFYLIENFNIDAGKQMLMEQYLPKVIQQEVDMLGYYFYGSALEMPEKTMKTTFENLKRFKGL